MLGAGSYLFTINIMSSDGSPVDDSVSFFVSLDDSNFDNVDGSSNNIKVIVTADPIPAGTYAFLIRIQAFTFPVIPVFVVEVEVRVLPHPRKCMISYRLCTEMYFPKWMCLLSLLLNLLSHIISCYCH